MKRQRTILTHNFYTIHNHFDSQIVCIFKPLFKRTYYE